jgi:hypothetical protein
MRTIEPEKALQIFKQGLQFAQNMDEPAWELFFDLWCCEVLIYHKVDTRAALDRTIRLATNAHQSRFEPYPVLRSQVFFILANLYFLIDPFGYADEIRELLDYTEQKVPMAQDTHLRILSIRAGMFFEHEQYDEARQATNAYLALAQGNHRRTAGAHERLAGIAYAKGDMRLALKHSEQHERFSQKEGDRDDIALAWLWQAVFLQRQGIENDARRKHFQGVWDYQQMAYVRRASYYDAVCTYLELTAKTDEALQLREEQLQSKVQHNSIVHEAKALLQYLRLLGRIGKPLDQALTKARILQKDMRQPDWFVQWLQQIESGNYFYYDWEKISKRGANKNNNDSHEI